MGGANNLRHTRLGLEIRSNDDREQYITTNQVRKQMITVK